ncbi:MAG: hypothetical protein ACYTF0_02630 [Planctomycetota bacterium]|jgi:hypothetical protein
MRRTVIRFFASSHRLDQLAPRTQVLCLLLLLGVLGQALSGIAMHHHGPGWTISSVISYYAGDTSAAALPAPTNDPFGEATSSDMSAPLALAKPWSALIEVAHIHLAIMPLLIFTLAHLFSMTALGRRRAVGYIAYAALAAASLDIIAPFLIRGGIHQLGAIVKLGSFAVLETGYLFMGLWTAAACARSLLTPAPPRRPVVSASDSDGPATLGP